MSLDSETLSRLTKLCGMFGSDHDGERANAAKMADALIRSKGLTWDDVLSPGRVRNMYERPGYDPFAKKNDKFHWDDRYWEIFDQAEANMGVITPWERSFIKSLSPRRGHPLTAKQKLVLDGIAAKLRK